ncbi:MAG: UDP-N-acetylmuramoyl-tripeptide--D-alanyl-D-alanine ligase [Porticoccus sp.]|nr:UDP-N-acetylmuramoyl-tripeptide--D-alanyl-D-alanine ligase [Porticoccus sp.]
MALEYGGTIMYPDCHFQSVSTDSRSLKKGQLFVALKGEKFDGHEFISLISSQASGLVVERPMSDLVMSQWVVPDTTKALGQIAAVNRKHLNGCLIAITGSCGKTLVKEMIAAILSKTGSVLFTKGNLNNEIGVPRTLMEIRCEHNYAVIEMGARANGDIDYLCSFTKPNVVLVNNILPAHLESFGTLSDIAKAKGEIYRNLSTGDTAVINLDESYAQMWHESTNARVLNFSINKAHADFTAKNLVLKENGSYSFILVTPEGESAISLTLSGKHNVVNAIAAAACSYAAGAPMSSIVGGLNHLKQIPGRMNLEELPSGVTCIDDSYNANPGSVKAAIDSLVEIRSLHILILGDMAELGDDEVSLHADIGSYALNKGVDILLALGPLSFYAAREFGQSGQHFKSKQELIDYLNSSEFLNSGVLDFGSAILVKGSRFMAMDDISQLIKKLGET